MSKARYFLFLALTLLSSTYQDQAAPSTFNEAQTQYLIEQAQFFAKQGIAQKDILEIIINNLTDEKNCAAKSKQASRKRRRIILAAGCTTLILIGSGLIYYAINDKQKEDRATTVTDALAPELVALFDNNAFTQEAELQNRLQPMVAQAVHLNPQIANLHRQHIQAYQERNLPRVIETAAQMKRQAQNPAIAAVFEQFMNQHPELHPAFEDPARNRRVDAINRHLGIH